MWEPDTLRAGPAGPGRSEDVMSGKSGKSGKGAARAVPRAYGRLTRHERDTVQRMLERGASCREIARELGRSPSTVSAEVSSHRFVTAPKSRRGERVDAGTDLSAACPRLAFGAVANLCDATSALTVEGDLPSSLAISLHDAPRSSILWTVSRSCLVSLP